MPRDDIHRIGRKLGNALRRLEKNSALGKEAKEVLRRFVEDLASRALSRYRQLWYLTHLVPAAEELGATFLDPMTEDVKEYLATVERSELSDWSKVNKRTAVKRFYKWLLGNDEEYPDCVRWIRTTAGNDRRKLPEDLPTPEEVEALVSGAVNARDKALIALLADGGLRIGEALSLRVKDFHPDEHGGYLIVPEGKTGARRVRLVDSIPHMTAWLKAHPFRDDVEAALFGYLTDQREAEREREDRQPERLQGHERGEPLTYAAARTAIRKAARRAGVPVSKVNPHNFRHYRATRLARDVPEAPLEAHMGWVPGSKMSGVYVHLSGRDTDEAILRAHGVDLGKEAGGETALPSRCSRCETWNESGIRFCGGCGMALTHGAASQVEGAEANLAEIVEGLVEKKLRELGAS